MSNPMPIYSQVVPKSQYRGKSGPKPTSRPQNLARTDFDPLNYNHGGNFQTSIAEGRVEKEKEKEKAEKRESRRSKEETGRPRRPQNRNETSEGKVEAYLRQNQVSIRQQQHRHSAVRQAEHRVNLRSLPLNDPVVARGGHDRTPTDRHRGFPERERDGTREHRRERERDRENHEFEGLARGEPAAARPVRKSSSAQRVADAPIAADRRRFFCREWAFQKIAHCLEQRPASKTCGALILGDAGSGKTALCQELSEPSAGPQARQQRALNRRLLARHFLQSHTESSLRPGEFVRSLAMQILSHSTRRARAPPGGGRAEGAEGVEGDGEEGEDGDREEGEGSPRARRRRRNSSTERLAERFRGLADDGEDSSKPLLADSEDQRTDEEELARDVRGLSDAPLTTAQELPEILPRASARATNPFINTDDPSEGDFKIYENHENLFLRNVSQRQSREGRAPRLQRQSSEPLADKRRAPPQQSLSADQRRADGEAERSKTECNSPPKVSSINTAGDPLSRIPVANFRYPNRSEVRSSSVDGSPLKSKPDPPASPRRADGEAKAGGSDPPEYQNVPAPAEDAAPVDVPAVNADGPVEAFSCEKRPGEDVAETFLTDFPIKDSPSGDAPPPIPRLPVSARACVADAYRARLLADADVQRALLPQSLERAPDECFRRALLRPLLEMEPPKQCLFLLVDAVDEGGCGSGSGGGAAEASSVAALLARQQHLFPQWLLLVATARRHSRSVTKMFTGFRKITLDELSRAHVSADVQRYMLARLDTEPRLRARVSSDSAAAAAAAAALDHLRIKSDGCLLYLEKVLDGVADGFIGLREIREIPGTLNGLYLWLAQRLFHGRRFTKVRLLLDVLLAARCRCGVTEEMLYKCLLTKECTVTREDFNRRLHLLRRVLVMEAGTGHLSLFHHSFARWLLDVKHCTRRYLCSAADGHAALAMYYTLDAKRLNAMEVHNYVYHMTHVEQQLASGSGSGAAAQFPLGLHALVLLWVLDSGCDVDAALRGRAGPVNENKMVESDEEHEASGEKTITSQSPLERIMPELAEPAEGAAAARWPRDARVLRALLELSRADCAGADPADMQIQELLTTEQPVEDEEGAEASAEEPEEAAPPDPSVLHELAAKGDDDALAALVKRHPHLVEAADASGGTALHAAARAGRAGAVAALLRAGARADAADADGWSPLRAAAWAGHTEVVEVLLDFGCDVDCVDADNRTALRAAAWSGHLAVVRRLLAAGAAPDRPDAEGRTPLIAAAYMGHADIVRALLDAGAGIDHADEDGRTALSVAALCGAGAAGAALLLERGADVARADRDRAQPLLVAAFEGHTEICELLLEAEADIEACDAAGRTALWAAASAGHASTVRLLLFWGACVDSMDGEGRTVLSTAAAQGNVEVVRQLLDRGLDEHHRDNSGWTPLHYAAFEGHIEVCEALLEAGAKVDEADNDGKGPLLLAAQEGHTRLVELLLDEWGAPVDQRAHDGKTALRLAALEGQFECVRALHARGADPDALDADRRSALYVLALDNRLAMARYMITHCGASVHTTDTEGRTPLHVSAWQGHTDMVNLLVKVGGACVESRDRCARTALHAAAWRGRGAALRALLQLGADPAAVCTQGATPLGIAAQEGHEECVLWLLQYGADPQQADHCGRTPAKVAWRAGHAAITRLLERAPRPASAHAAPAHAAPTAPPAPTAPAALDEPRLLRTSNSPEGKRRSVHSSNSTKSSSNLTGGSARSHEPPADPAPLHDKQANRANLSLSFAQQVARCGRGRRGRERDGAIPEHRALEQDDNLRSYLANERDAELRGYRRERDGRRDARHGGGGAASPLYASPPRSPASDLCSPTQPPDSQPASLLAGAGTGAGAGAGAGAADTHFNRDTHMRIILGRDCKPPPDRSDSEAWSGRGRVAYTRLVGSITRARGKIFKKTKNKRNGIVTNPAMRLVANVRNGLDSAAANIRRTGVALAASASSANPAVRSNAFQWRKETHL